MMPDTTPDLITPHNAAPVSVIIPCYRCADTIERALDSVLGQTHPVAEILLVDDVSGDETLSVLYELQNRYVNNSIRVIERRQNGGPGAARNSGWDAATQPWLAFLDADDAWHPQKIEIQFGWLEKQDKVDLCAHDSLLWTESFMRQQVDGAPPFKIPAAKLLIRNLIPARSVMLRKDLPFRFGGKDVTEDYLMWLELALRGHACWKLPLPLACSFRPEFSPGGYSGALWAHEKRELRCFMTLHKKGLFGLLTLAAVSMFSLIKYCRRFLIMWKVCNHG